MSIRVTVCMKTGTVTQHLRAAIMEANATTGFDVIRLGTGTYTLTLGRGIRRWCCNR